MYPTRVLERRDSRTDSREMGNRVRYYRERASLSQEALAKRVNSGRSTIVKLERGERPLNSQWLDKLSRELNCTPADLVGDDVPVVGRIGAGGSILFEEVILDSVRRPPETPGELVGLEVSGDSMMPKFDPGDIIFISRDHNGVLQEYVGAICAVRLVTGEAYLKILAKGTRPGLFTLRSLNTAYPDIEDVELEWATPYRAMQPRFARHLT